MNYIELFAGCGGLSLGLESENFELLLANELSPMAAETFAYNHLDLNLNDNGIRQEDPIYWISSQYPRDNSKARLQENPLSAIGLENRISDITDIAGDFHKLRRSLLVGSILDLNKLLKKRNLKNTLKNGFGDGQVDLVSGGPPCQSFSMAGMRQHSNERNSLPWAFAEFVRQIKPRIALLENVSGILRAFDVEGSKYYAWYEVAKAFAVEGYIPICLHVNAKYVGAAQNRPRFIMIALREDVAKSILSHSDEKIFTDALNDSLSFYRLVRKGKEDLEYGHLKYHDVENGSNLFDCSLFSPLVTSRIKGSGLVSVKDAIDDLNGHGSEKSQYVKTINTKAYKKFSSRTRKLSNHEFRNNSSRVQARFRLYQLMNVVSSESRNEIRAFLRSGEHHHLSKNSLKEISSAGWLMMPNGKRVQNLTTKNVVTVLESLGTKKQTQRALKVDEPAPAALSIPDDACHYHDGTLRTLTVREMARIQSFPDWFEFRSKVTTGGQMRKFQVPQYTQVGNAVPPLLGKALGKVCKGLIELSS